ncbi:MAG: peptidoglycan DD-metalloendopeptidase family protein [bacterium]|nr:peptidoglycan DD-metalloendopeptidase family protein [bacterium]
MTVSGRLLILLLICLMAVSELYAGDTKNILSQKKELEQLQRDVEEGRRRLDSLQSAETGVQKKISEYDQKISSDRKIIRRLNNELNQLQKDIVGSDSTLQQNQSAFDRSRRRYLGNIRQFYMVAQQPAQAFTDLPNEELELKRRVVYLSALASFESSAVDQASELLDQSVGELDDVTGRADRVSGLKKERETSYAVERSQKQRHEKSLDQLRRRTMAEADRVTMLEKAAEEMAAIIARLEEERARAAQEGRGDTGPSVFAGLKGQLSSPYRGKITMGFGLHVHEVTRLESFSPGITIEGRAGRTVYAVASGTVAYAGNLRGYGNFVIINHDHQYYTTYAGLETVQVAQGQFLTARTKLGVSDSDGVIKFELRKGREPLDPVKWIKIESL